MKKLGIGVIGTGYMGQMHASIFHDLPNTELIGVTDQDPQRAKDLADKLGVKAFEDYHNLLKCSNI
jgi:predicted dehydrogenase